MTIVLLLITRLPDMAFVTLPKD